MNMFEKQDMIFCGKRKCPMRVVADQDSYGHCAREIFPCLIGIVGKTRKKSKLSLRANVSSPLCKTLLCMRRYRSRMQEGDIVLALEHCDPVEVSNG